MTTHDSRKYDIAFSFVAQDEVLATRLDSLLRDKYRTFIYSKSQESLAGNDGETIFSDVFGSQSTLVVVLYRPAWGTSPWTRIEQTAIRNRAFEHGYDFCLFVPLESPFECPKWLPRTRIWYDIGRWGEAAAAAVIEARLQDQGGAPQVETLAQHAARIEIELKFGRRREAFMRDYQGVTSANREVSQLFEDIERDVAEIRSSTPSLVQSCSRRADGLIVQGDARGIRISWHCRYTNSLDKSALIIELWEPAPINPNGIYPFEKPRILKSMEFDFDMLIGDELGWRPMADRSRFFSTRVVATHIVRFLLDSLAKK